MRTIVAVILLAALRVPVAFGQAPVMPACDGDPTLIRISTIKPTGSLAGFMKAQDAHRAWYRSHGFTTNEIYSARIMVMDMASKTAKYSDTEVMTFHVRPPTGAKQDAEWEAYVKLYRDNSDIKTEYMICLPKTR